MLKKIFSINCIALSIFASQKSHDTNLVLIQAAQKSKPAIPDYLDSVSEIQPIQDIIRGYLNSFELSYEIPAPGNMSIGYSPDGKYLFSLTARKSGDNLYIYDTVAQQKKYSAARPHLHQCVISAFGQLAYLLCDIPNKNFELGVIDVNSGTQLYSGPQGNLGSRILFSPDGTYLASITFDKIVYLFSVKNYSAGQKFSLPGRVHAVQMQFSPDNKYLVGSYGKTIRVWDTSSTAPYYADFSNLSQTLDVIAIAFISNTKFITLDTLGSLVVWDILKKNCESVVKIAEKDLPLAQAIVSANGQFLAAPLINDNSQVIIWDRLQAKHTYIKTTERVEKIQFSPDGKQLAIKCGSTIQLYDVSSDKIIQEIPLSNNDWIAFDFSPDGNQLALGTKTNTQILVNQCMQLTNFKK